MNVALPQLSGDPHNPERPCFLFKLELASNAERRQGRSKNIISLLPTLLPCVSQSFSAEIDGIGEKLETVVSFQAFIRKPKVDSVSRMCAYQEVKLKV